MGTLLGIVRKMMHTGITQHRAYSNLVGKQPSLMAAGRGGDDKGGSGLSSGTFPLAVRLPGLPQGGPKIDVRRQFTIAHHNHAVEPKCRRQQHRRPDAFAIGL